MATDVCYRSIFYFIFVPFFFGMLFHSVVCLFFVFFCCFFCSLVFLVFFQMFFCFFLNPARTQNPKSEIMDRIETADGP